MIQQNTKHKQFLKVFKNSGVFGFIGRNIPKNNSFRKKRAKIFGTVNGETGVLSLNQ